MQPPGPGRPPRPPVAAAGGLFLLFWALYAGTAVPTVATVDSGEITLAMAGLGVAHPPGFAAVIPAGHLASRLPLGDLGHRANLFSAFFGALTVSLLFLGARAWMPEANSGWPAFGAALAAAAYGAGRTAWGLATVAEVYTFTTALVAAAILAAARRNARGERAAALLAGLALAAHLVTAVLALPGLALLAGLRRRPWRERRRLPLWLLLGCLPPVAGLALRAAAGPQLAWGRPSTWNRLAAHVTAWQYRVHLFEAPLSETLALLAESLLRWGREATWLWPAAAGAGIVLLVRAGRGRLVWPLATWGLAALGYTSIYRIAEDVEAYLLLLFMATALAAAPALAWAAARLAGKARPAAVALALAPLALVLLAAPETSRRHDYLARDAAAGALASARHGALVLTQDWQFYAPALYLRALERWRPDLAIVDVNLLRYSWYPALLAAESPALMATVEPERADFGRQQALFESGRRYDPAAIQTRFEALIGAMRGAARESGGEVYITPLTEPYVAAGEPVTGEGLLLRLGPPPVRVPAIVPGFPLRGLTRRIPPGDALATKVIPAIVQCLTATGAGLLREGRPDAALEILARAAALARGRPEVAELAADALLAAGRRSEAEAMYRRLVESGFRHPRVLEKLRSLGAE